MIFLDGSLNCMQLNIVIFSFSSKIFAKHFERFSISWKHPKVTMLQANLHQDAGGYTKKQPYHDDQSKNQSTHISNFQNFVTHFLQ